MIVINPMKQTFERNKYNNNHNQFFLIMPFIRWQHACKDISIIIIIFPDKTARQLSKQALLLSLIKCLCKIMARFVITQESYFLFITTTTSSLFYIYYFHHIIIIASIQVISDIIVSSHHPILVDTTQLMFISFSCLHFLLFSLLYLEMAMNGKQNTPNTKVLDASLRRSSSLFFFFSFAIQCMEPSSLSSTLN